MLFFIILFIIIIAAMIYLNIIVNDFEKKNQQLLSIMEKRYSEPSARKEQPVENK